MRNRKLTEQEQREGTGLIAFAFFCLVLGVLMSCASGCSTLRDRAEREIERERRRIEPDRKPDEKPDDGRFVPIRGEYPWLGKTVHVDSSCDEDVTPWEITAHIPHAAVGGTVLRWVYLQGEGPRWRANGRLDWAQSNVMIMARRGDRWETWYGHWLRYGQTSQCYRGMFDERGRAWPPAYDEIWFCVAAPNRHRLNTARERSNWVRLK